MVVGASSGVLAWETAAVSPPYPAHRLSATEAVIGVVLSKRARGVRHDRGLHGVRTTLVLLVAFVTLWGCNRGASHERAGPPSQSEARIVRAESADVDAAVKRVPNGKDLVQSYRIEDERLNVTVDADAWKQVGEARQDALKKAMWKEWSESYHRHRGQTGERIFVSIYDLQGNDLGSYFE
jgi:hypothetical protein